MQRTFSGLVDVAGHSPGNRQLVFARKPAPLQIAYLGYPGSTGSAAIDVLISITFLPKLTLPDYFAAHNDVDVLLDSFPFNGGTTTCHALWMGVPIVSLAGAPGAGRIGASLLHRVGLDDLLAENESAFAGIAANLAEDQSRRKTLRQNLREQCLQSPLLKAADHVSALEAIYRSAWQRRNQCC